MPEFAFSLVSNNEA